MKQINLQDIFNDREQWPECPECKVRSVLVGGHLAGCTHCGYLGFPSDLEQTDLLKFSKTKLAQSSYAWRGVLSMFTGQNSNEEHSILLEERASQIAQRLVHWPYFEKAQQHFVKKGTFNKTAIYNSILESSKTQSVTLSSEEAESRFKERALRQDICSVMQEEDGLFVIDTHIYNAPSHRQSIGYFRKVDKVELDKVMTRPSTTYIPYSLVWQPIDWKVMNFVHNKIQPVWVAAFEIERDTNVTMAVCENMDGDPQINVSFREPWSSSEPTYKSKNFQTAEEGIEYLKEIYNKAVESTAHEETGSLVFSYEKTFGLDEPANSVLHQIRKAEFWGPYTEMRNVK